ncbi:potassium channel family protein [Bacillus dakarensis]|uniref:potassium channel family protein n=1 Tax=Robertmurraya dakarensis TaxID=1926278 RepID=UPI000981130D|nr:TrkA family potassium uptake protein [Bacillus dakarensis]
MKKQFVVIGLGRFGSSVCKELYHLGHEVLAVDLQEGKVRDMVDFSTHAVVANGTEEKDLKALGVRNFDYGIVAIGENIEASIQSTLLLKELGLKAVVKAQNIHHHKILDKIGADRIIHPEQDMGIRVAHQLDSEKVIEFIELSKDYSIVEMEATPKLNNKTLVQLNIRAKYGCTVLAIKRGEDINIAPHPDDVIFEKDILVVMGHKQELKRLEDKGI